MRCCSLSLRTTYKHLAGNVRARNNFNSSCLSFRTPQGSAEPSDYFRSAGPIYAPPTRFELALQPWQGCVLGHYTTGVFLFLSCTYYIVSKEQSFKLSKRFTEASIKITSFKSAVFASSGYDVKPAAYFRVFCRAALRFDSFIVNVKGGNRRRQKKSTD